MDARGRAISTRQAAPEAGVAAAWRRAGCGSRRSTGAGSPISRRNRRGLWSFWIFLVAASACRSAPNSSPTTGRSSSVYKGELLCSRSSSRLSGREIRRLPRRAPIIATRSIAKEIDAHGWMIWPPIRFSYAPSISALADARALAADLDADQGAMRGRRAKRFRQARPDARLPRHRMELARHRRSGPRRAWRG